MIDRRFVTFAEAERYLDSLGIDRMKSMAPSLDRIDAICELMDRPERQVPAIHVTGTNGKTSTACIAASLLSAAGLRVGTYTSPHLQSVRERIAMDGEPIGEGAFAAAFEHLAPYLDLTEARLGEQLSYFEVLTAMFFLWAAGTPVDAAVVEVGMGGRWDATNVISAPVSVVTNVDLDHTSLLGGDRVTIAREKSGIIKAGATLVTAERRPDVLDVLEDEVRKADGSSRRIDREFSVTDNRVALGGRYVSIATSACEYEGLFLPLHGAHQGVNAAVALEAITSFLGSALDAAIVNEGFANAIVPGRMEVLRHPDAAASVLLDVAHNPDGMSALVSAMSEAFAFERVTFVVGALSDKDFGGMLTEIARIPARLIATAPSGTRAVPPADLAGVANELGLECEVVERVEEALAQALAVTEGTDLVCVTGSHYVVGEARERLLASRSAS